MKHLFFSITLILIFTTSINTSFASTLSESTITAIKNKYNKTTSYTAYSYLGIGTASLTISAISNPAFLGVAIPVTGYGTYLKFFKNSPYSLLKSPKDTQIMSILLKQTKYKRYKKSAMLVGLSFYTYMMMNNDIFNTELSQELSSSLPYVSLVPLTASLINLKRKSYIEQKLKDVQFPQKSASDSLKILAELSPLNKKDSGLKNILLAIMGSSIAIGTKHNNLLAISTPFLALGIYDRFFSYSLKDNYENIKNLPDKTKNKEAKTLLKTYAKKTKTKRLIIATSLAATSYFLATQKDDEYLIEHELQALSFITGSLSLFNFTFSWPLESIAKQQI